MTELGKRTFNAICRRWMDGEVELFSETAYAVEHDVSRTTIREALKQCQQLGILSWEGRTKTLLRKPTNKDLYVEQGGDVKKGEELTRQIMHMLTRGELEPGCTFSERELALRFGCTTGTIREALLKCATYPILAKRPRHRWQVMELDAEKGRQALDFREVLEMAVLETLCRVGFSPTQRKALEAMAQTLKQSMTSPPSASQALDMDEAFHGLLAESTGNPYLIEACRGTFVLIQMQYRHISSDDSTLSQSTEQHLGILDAVLEGKVVVAQGILHEHLELARRRLGVIHASGE